MSYHRFSYAFFLAFLYFQANSLLAQQKSNKPSVDFEAIENWTELGGTNVNQLSNDGKYFFYSVVNIPVDSSTAYIQSTETKWQKSFVFKGGRTPIIDLTNDNKKYLVSLGRDTLGIGTLGKDAFVKIPGVGSFGVPKEGHSGVYYYTIIDKFGKKLVLQSGSKQIQVNRIQNPRFSDDGKSFFYLKIDSLDKNIKTICYLDLNVNRMHQVFSGKGELKYILDKTSKRFGILQKETNKSSVYLYTNGDTKAILVATDLDFRKKGFSLIDISEFSLDGKRIYAYLQKDPEKTPAKKSQYVKVDIWNYKDKEIQSIQPETKREPEPYMALLDLEKKSLAELADSETVINRVANSDLLIMEKKGNRQLFSPIEGWKRNLPWLAPDSSYFYGVTDQISISPDGNFAVYFDKALQAYLSYNLVSGETINLTKDLSVNWKGDGDGPRSINTARGYVNWVQNSHKVVVYDRFDIWLLDATGVDAPINITKGYGAKNNIVFEMVVQPFDVLLKKNQSLLINAFDFEHKTSGLFFSSLSNPVDPSRIKLFPATFNGRVGNKFYRPIKARDENVFLLEGSMNFKADNYYLTKDFNSIKQLTYLAPEKNYNWLTKEVLGYNLPDGRRIHGVLFKPEDFDPTKKYPLIIYYYERLSATAYTYSPPSLSNGPIDVPWFTSHGYLVLEADIYSTPGHPGEAALTCINAAADAVEKLPYVDSKHIGINGHSWGGYETNYIVTHTSRFAVAASGAGLSNLISLHGSLMLGGNSRQSMVEDGQVRMGGTPWDMQENYIQNSPVFNIDKVTTPILMMANKNDGSVPYAQGIEFYMGLRRLQKKAWLLEYEGDFGHILLDKENQKDYTTRLMQFYDHYLKEKPAPKWMTVGIPKYLKGVDDGLELDPSGQP